MLFVSHFLVNQLELILVYHSNSYSVAYEERFIVIHVPCLTSTIVVMLLVNSNSKVRNCFRIVFIFFLKQPVDIVLAMNASMLTEPMQDRKRSKWLLMVSNKLLLIKNMLCATYVLNYCRTFHYPTVIQALCNISLCELYSNLQEEMLGKTVHCKSEIL